MVQKTIESGIVVEERSSVFDVPEEQPIAQTPTGQSRLAYRLAAGVLVVNVVLLILDLFLVAAEGGGTPSFIPIVIDIVLAVGLIQLRAGARRWVLIRAGIGAIVWPILAFVENDALTAIFMTIIQWGFTGSLALLLTGKSETWRLALGVGIFVVFVLVLFALALLMIALASLAGL